MTGPADDLIYGGALFRQFQDAGVLLLAARPTGMLAEFGAAQSIWIDNIGTDRLADHPHGASHRRQESGAGIFHEMPSVGDLMAFGLPSVAA